MASGHRRRRVAFLGLVECAGAVWLVRAGLIALPTSLVPDVATLPGLLGVLAVALLSLVVGWVALTSLAYATARLIGATTSAARFGRVIPGPLRRVIDAGLALWLSVSLLTAGGAAAADQFPDEQATVRPTAAKQTAGARPRPEVPHLGLLRLSHRRARSPATAAPVTGAQASEYTVRKGDNLWRIALAHLADNSEPNVGLGSYWRLVIETNRGRIRSGDPNLIFPGEVILLPPVTGA